MFMDRVIAPHFQRLPFSSDTGYKNAPHFVDFHFVTVVSGYPLFLLHRHFLRRSEAWIQHLYFAVTGLFMSWWAIGSDAVFHSAACILITYLVLKFGGGNAQTSGILFAFNLGYLFIGKGKKSWGHIRLSILEAMYD